MRRIINTGKDGRIIEDLSKEELPEELERRIFEILNPGLKVVKFKDKENEEK